MVSSRAPDLDRVERRLHWEGCFNVRDLGGHRTLDGADTRWGALVRSDARERLTGTGWSALRKHGVTTIVDLRDPAEHKHGNVRDDGIEVIAVPLLDLRDEEFWREGRWRGQGHSLAFYLALLERWPERFAAAVVTVARAQPGGVLIHCQAGRDRTGLVAAALLMLVGVEVESIAADYSESEPSLQPLYDTWIENAVDESERERIRRENSSEAAVMRELLSSLDLRAFLLEHGVDVSDISRLCERLLGPPTR